jgi:hypothetical protein
MKKTSIIAGCLLLAAFGSMGASVFEKPFRVESDGKPIDTDIGHSFPIVGDFDDDGNFDLLVGQFGSGQMRIYRNIGDNKSPKFGPSAWFKVEGGVGKVPAG